MAKRNTWQQKQMHKLKQHVLREKLGSEKGVLTRGGAAVHCLSKLQLEQRRVTLQVVKEGLDEPGLVDKPLPSAPKVQDFDYSRAPMRAGWKPERYVPPSVGAAAAKLTREQRVLRREQRRLFNRLNAERETARERFFNSI